ncbi:5'(3')-deoxyribonucleotidase [Staphylococcus condimenti]|uniref:Putative 5'(3')-deoxyribonucleotidase n=1 Tax=Staphylococcus condimenti TaxID=70255 RepID=A0A143PCJ6_9STAP|nr:MULTISPECIES: 5'-3'-deoxyribonucleotidase [Staphylococcus]AMY05479.1 5'(3')-deoxyribonucleotidase [Staphylococcus condimenti]APR61685.1 5'(3')-deoxyribonucleotidase [Staphylococcus condimenti]MDK8644538.1 5'(3')-deoxyribonucleotidase [Staphylococcus condimenti]OFP02618.1 5'(3')-deoxyribonucleotidase [Staphylococcus sp. HMSC065E08]PNZ62033.1 5'(3')-deoxyribonucleotidase [Staphylococcus condimenti]
MERESIAIDMDEVLADTIKALIEEVNARTDLGIKETLLDGNKLRHFMPEHEGVLDEVLKEPGFFKNLEVIQDSQEVVEKLSKHYDVYIATAAMDVPTSFHEKYEWLRMHFPFLDPQNFVFCGRKNIVKADYLIDDNPRQLARFTGKSLMYTAAHNIHNEDFDRVNNWREIEKYFLGNEEI